MVQITKKKYLIYDSKYVIIINVRGKKKETKKHIDFEDKKILKKIYKKRQKCIDFIKTICYYNESYYLTTEKT